MENASKALVIAGGVLITILVVSLFILFVNQVSDFEKSRSDEVKDSQLASFNEQFIQYARNDLKNLFLISPRHNTRGITLIKYVTPAITARYIKNCVIFMLLPPH